MKKKSPIGPDTPGADFFKLNDRRSCLMLTAKQAMAELPDLKLKTSFRIAVQALGNQERSLADWNQILNDFLNRPVTA